MKTMEKMTFVIGIILITNTFTIAQLPDPKEILQKVKTAIQNIKVIDKIITHLKLIFFAERPPPPQIVHKELLVAAEERGEYF